MCHRLTNLHNAALEETYIFLLIPRICFVVFNETADAQQNPKHSKPHHQNFPKCKEDNIKQCIS